MIEKKTLHCVRRNSVGCNMLKRSDEVLNTPRRHLHMASLSINEASQRAEASVSGLIFMNSAP